MLASVQKCNKTEANDFFNGRIQFLEVRTSGKKNERTIEGSLGFDFLVEPGHW
jgi:hypothetical protein